MGPVLPALDEQGIAGTFRIAEFSVVAQPRAGGVARVANDVDRCRDADGKSPALVERAGENQRRRRILHGMDVEQQIDGVHQRANFPRPPQLDTVAGTIEHFGGPDTVEILVDIA